MVRYLIQLQIDKRWTQQIVSDLDLTNIYDMWFLVVFLALAFDLATAGSFLQSLL
jgi:hypothetical protein